jgi:hypothetical protein
LLKETLRELYHEPLFVVRVRLDAWLAWASRSRLQPLVKLARTIREHREGILAAIQHGLSHGRLEGLNNRIRLLSHQAFGFHSAGPLLAMVYLCCAGIKIPLLSDRRPQVDPYRLWENPYCQGSCQNVVVCRSNADCAGILVREHNGWRDKYLPSQCVPCPVPGVKCCALPTWWDWPP